MTQSTSRTLTALAATTKILKQDQVSLLDVVRAIQTDANRQSTTPARAPLPKKIAFTEEHRRQLAEVARQIEDLRLPQTRRVLRADEKRRILKATESFKSLEKLMKTSVDQAKAAFFNSLDVVAEQDGRAVPGETPTDKNGWYLLKDTESGIVPDEAMKMTREPSSGSVTMTVEGLDNLLASGVISVAERKAAIRMVPTVDEGAVIQLMKDKPHLIPEIASVITQTSAPSVSFGLRQNK